MFGAAKIRPALEGLLNWIYPEKCRQCDAAIYVARPADKSVLSAAPFFCCDCWGNIEGVGPFCCPLCAFPFQSEVTLSHSSNHVCGDCRAEPPYFTKAVTPYRYEGALAKAIQLFKYEEQVALAKPLAHLLIDELKGIKIDLVTAVPLHPVKLRSRSFNQSLLLAKRVASHFGWPFYVDVMCRTRETMPQVGLSKKARQKNMRGVFCVQGKDRILNKHILLIDDVYTTGATLKEGAKTLMKADAKAVIVAAPVRMIFGV